MCSLQGAGFYAELPFRIPPRRRKRMSQKPQAWLLESFFRGHDDATEDDVLAENENEQSGDGCQDE